MREFHVVWYRTGTIGLFGGAERVAVEGLRCFREMGVRTTLLLHEPISSETAAFFGSHHPDIAVVPGFSLTERAPGRLNRLWQFFRRVRNLRATLKALAPSLVVANDPNDCYFLWLYSLAGLIPLRPTVTFIHGSPFQFADDVTKYSLAFRRHLSAIRSEDPVYREIIPSEAPAMGRRQRVRLEIECYGLRAATQINRVVFVLTEKNRKEVERLYGIRNVQVLSPGGFTRMSLAHASQNSLPSAAAGISRPILLSVCRLIAKKRVDLLIRAFRIFLHQNPQSTASLVIGGTGPERDALRDLAGGLGLDGRVWFIGFIPDSDLRGWYQASDVFLSADNADYDLSVMMALPERRKVIVSTQYDIPAGLISLRRFFFVAEPSPRGYGETIARALATTVPNASQGDERELQALTWESYFEELLNISAQSTSLGGRWMRGITNETGSHAGCLRPSQSPCNAFKPS